jgi:hypothetical protein
MSMTRPGGNEASSRQGAIKAAQTTDLRNTARSRRLNAFPTTISWAGGSSCRGQSKGTAFRALVDKNRQGQSVLGFRNCNDFALTMGIIFLKAFRPIRT